MTVPSVEGLLTSPYVTIAEFQAAPTWVDSDDLIPQGTGSQEDAELTNVLLRASAWADGFVCQRLGAHTVFEQLRGRIDRLGRIILHPSNVPVRQVTGFAYGTDPTNLNALSTSDLSHVWIEDARGIVVALSPLNATFSGPLQFGPPATPGYEMYCQIQYVAGYANTTLSANVTAGASSLSVVDGTGFVAPSTTLVGALGGSVARIWEPGVEEAVQMGASYVTGSNTLALMTPTMNAHAQGAAVSEFPAEVRMGIITYAIALLLRDETESAGGGGRFGPALRKLATTGSPPGLIADAQNWLERYRRVR